MKRFRKALVWTGGFIAGCVHDLGKSLTQAFHLLFHLFFVATFAGAGLVSGVLLGWMIFKAIAGVE